jgi:hypothetical protein
MLKLKRAKADMLKSEMRNQIPDVRGQICVGCSSGFSATPTAHGFAISVPSNVANFSPWRFARITRCASVVSLCRSRVARSRRVSSRSREILKHLLHYLGGHGRRTRRSFQQQGAVWPLYKPPPRADFSTGRRRTVRKRTNSSFCSGGSASEAASISSSVLIRKVYHR